MEPITLNGEEFNKKFAGTKFYKMMDENQDNSIEPGLYESYSDLAVIHFNELKYALLSIHARSIHLKWYIREVTIPDDATVVIENQGFRTDNIIFGKLQDLNLFFGSEGNDKFTIDDCFAAVLSNGVKLKFIPEQFRTFDLCSAAVNKSGMALQYVPDKFLTYEICLAAISNVGFALMYVPYEFRTEEFCWIAAHRNCFMEYIPSKFRSLEMCLKIITSIDNDALYYVPDELKAEVVRLKTEELKARLFETDSSGDSGEDIEIYC